MKKVEAEADSLAARLKVEFGRGEGGGLPCEGELEGQSADDHLYKVCIVEMAPHSPSKCYCFYACSSSSECVIE